jgi:hypothetical protein
VAVNDRQLTIAEIPADGEGGTRTPGGSLGSRPRRRTPKNATPDVPRHVGVDPERAASRRPTGRQGLSAREVYALGVRTDLVTACRIALGVGSTTAYALAGHGELPFPAHRVGRQWVVPTAGLLAFLGLPPQEPPSTVAH